MFWINKVLLFFVYSTDPCMACITHKV